MSKLTRKEQKERTRESIIGVAEELFAKNGISATTTADIAKAVGLSHGALFVHFANRDELLLSVVDQFGERLSQEMSYHFDASKDLKSLLKAHISVLTKFENFYLRLISESQSLPPSIRGQLYALNSSLSYRFYRVALPDIKNGVFKKLDQASFVNTWLGILHFNILNRDLFSDKLPLLAHNGDELVKLFLNLIKSS